MIELLEIKNKIEKIFNHFISIRNFRNPKIATLIWIWNLANLGIQLCAIYYSFGKHYRKNSPLHRGKNEKM